MILIKKKESSALPQIFQNWLAENQSEIAVLNTNLRPARELWDSLGKRLSNESETQIDPKELRHGLTLSLYEEQGGICCYCGERISREQDEKGSFKNQSIEHFKPKNLFKDLIFNYENLMLCCNSSSQFSKIEIGGRYKLGDSQSFIEAKNEDDVEKISGISFDKIIYHRSNQQLKKKIQLKGKIEKGDLFHIPNPPHCDNNKSKFDAEKGIEIINPTKDKHLIDKLSYDSVGRIMPSNAKGKDLEIIQQTIKVLGLNIEKLTEKRKRTWNNTDNKFAESFAEINSADLPINKRKEIIRTLIDKTLEPDESTGLLAPFCFVEFTKLKSQFISIFE